MNNIASAKKIHVLIVDDSAVVRQVLSEILNSDPEIEVIGSAADPYIAAEKLRTVIPDVITLDIEMPRMDGITFLHKIMTQHPLPVVICSSLADENCETTLKALEYGAVDIITKPKIGIKKYLEESHILICDSVKAAAFANIKSYKPKKQFKMLEVTEKLSADAMLDKPTSRAMIKTTERVIVVGASTGGTEALRVFLQALPIDCPGIIIVQHMPENFTKAFAERLNRICDIEVKEASDGDSIIRGRVLIAPGNKHAILKRSGARYYVEVKDGPLISRHRPSVDVLFRSAAQYAGQNAVGIIMTGMGDDGAQGILEMKNSKAFTIAQDEKSCVVFGMPKEAIKKEAIDVVLPLNQIAREVIKYCLK